MAEQVPATVGKDVGLVIFFMYISEELANSTTWECLLYMEQNR